MATPRTPKVPYPTKNDFKTFYLYKEGKCIFKGNEQELFRSQFGANHNSIAFKKAMKAYNDEQKEIHDEFMQNVIDIYEQEKIN